MQNLYIDHISLPKVTDAKTGVSYENALSIIDEISNYALCIPVQDLKAETTALALHKNWLTRFGMPVSINSDRGTSFTSKIFIELCRIYGIKCDFAPSQHHQSQGRVENFHGLISRSLRKLSNTK